MTKTLIVAASLLAASLLIGPGVAKADGSTDAFLTDMHANGFYNSQYGDQSLLAMGINSCRQMEAGIPYYTVANNVWLGTHLDTFGALQFVEFSAKDLCPSYFGGDTSGGRDT